MEKPRYDLGDIDPESPVGQALTYLEENRVGLTVFAERRGASWRAEDAVQEAAINLFRYGERIQPVNIPALVKTTVAREALDHCREDARKIQQDPLDEAYWIPSPQATPEDIVLRKETTTDVQTAVANLEDPHREIVTLIDLREYNYAEAAAITGLADGTIKSRLSRGRGVLRQRILEKRAADRMNVTSTVYASDDSGSDPQQ